jgi:hypothetical protein
MIGATEEALFANVSTSPWVGGQTSIRDAGFELAAVQTVLYQPQRHRFPTDAGAIRMEVKRYSGVTLDAQQRFLHHIGRNVAHPADVILRRQGIVPAGLREDRDTVEGCLLRLR